MKPDRIVHQVDRRSTPARVVAIGGGTGMPSVLRGLRPYASRGEISDLAAIVTMSDDGGSSGRLRKSMGLLPPGDVRNNLVALAADEDLIADLFQHRYSGSEELGGHTLGNLILAAFAERTGSFLQAIELSSRILRVSGRILPSTLQDVTLRAVLDDGAVLEGETRIAAAGISIREISLMPARVPPAPGVIDAILEADLIVLGPGSLFTSIVPNLVVDGVGEALRKTAAAVVFVANIVRPRNEASSLDIQDHVRILEQHAGGEFIDSVLVHQGAFDAEVLGRYAAEGAVPLVCTSPYRAGILIQRRNLLAVTAKLRHDPEATAAGLLDLWTTRDLHSTEVSARRGSV